MELPLNLPFWGTMKRKFTGWNIRYRLVLLFEKNVEWNYKLTPLLSNVVNDYKRNRAQFLSPPAAGQRGKLTSRDVLAAKTPQDCQAIVKAWAHSVYEAFYSYREEVEPIISQFLTKR